MTGLVRRIRSWSIEVKPSLDAGAIAVLVAFAAAIAIGINVIIVSLRALFALAVGATL